MTQYAASHLLIALTEEEYKITEQAKSTILDIYDRFTVEIPYANSYIKARIMLSAVDPLLPPDLIILYPALEVSLDYITLFRDWNPTDRRAFLVVFERVKSAFTAFYLEIFNILKTPQMDQIYKSCLGFVQNKDIELLLSYDDEEIKEIIFALPMPVTLTHESCTKPVYCNVSLRSNYDKFSLDIMYPFWASHLHSLNIGKISSMTSWPLHRFEELLRQVYAFFIKEINAVCNSKDQRALFFTYLNNAKIGLLLEVDTVDFLKMSFHNEIPKGNIVEIINIVVILEKDFPKTSPIYKLRSMKSIKNGELREKKYPKVRMWDQDLDIEALAEMFKKTVGDELQGFLTWIDS